MKALVSWEDAEGMTHRFQIAYEPDDAEARHFLDAEGDASWPEPS